MNFLNRLASLFEVRPAERRLVGHMFVLALCLGVPGIAVETAGYSLFLNVFDAQALPYVYVGFALTAVVTGTLYNRLERQVSFRALVTFQLLFLFISLVVFRALLFLEAGNWPYFMLAVWTDMVYVLVALSYWTLAGHLFNLQQSKRLYGLLVAGVISAEVVTGLLTTPIVRAAGTANMLVVAAAAVGLALVVQAKTLKTFASGTVEVASEEEPEPVSTRSLMGDGYIRLILGLAAVSIAAYYFLDNLFYSQASLAYDDPDQLAGFLGIFFAVSGVGTVLAGAFLSRQITGRHGVFASLLVMPVVLLVGTLGTILAAAIVVVGALVFWLASGTKMMSDALNESINRTAFRVLYQPLSQSQRVQIQTATESIIEPVSAGAAGLLLLLLHTQSPGSMVPILLGLLVLLLIAIVLILRLRPAYPRVLRQSLQSRIMGRGELLDVDKATLLALREGLSDRRPGATIYILDLLETADAELYQESLQELLDHQEAVLRLEALRRIERHQYRGLLPAVYLRLPVESNVAVRGAAIRTVAVLGGRERFNVVYPALDDSEPIVKENAAAGLLVSGDLEGMLYAGERLLSWVRDPDPAQRIMASQVLCRAAIPSLHRPVAELLVDEDKEVRKAALEAAGRVKHPSLMPLVIDQMESPKLRGAAGRALVAGGEDSLAAIAATLRDGDRPLEVDRQLARVCGLIGGEEAVTILMSVLARPAVAMRQEVVAALARCGYRADERLDVEAGIRQGVQRVAWLLAGQVDLSRNLAGDGSGFLPDTLGQAFTRQRHELFDWLVLKYEPDTIKQAAAAFSDQNDDQGRDEQRAKAQELVEVAVGSPLKEWLRPLLEPLAPRDRLAQLQAFFPQPTEESRERLLTIISAPAELGTPWLRAIAIHEAVLGATPIEVTQLLAAIPESEGASPLVAESLAWSLAQEERDAGARQARDLDISSDRKKGTNSMLTTVEKVIALKSVDLFADTADETLTEVAAIAVEHGAAAGEDIIAKGEAGDALFIIVDGTVKVHDADREFNRLGANDVFGEMSLLDPAPRSASVTAVTDSLLMRLDREPFFELLAVHPEISKHIMRLLTRRIRGLMARLSPEDLA